MNFQGLSKIEKPDIYLDMAFKRANKDAGEVRAGVKGKGRVEKSRKVEIAKLDAVKKVLYKQLSIIIQSFPSMDDLPEYYKELVKCFLDYNSIKLSLSKIQWSFTKIGQLCGAYSVKIKKCQHVKKINVYRNECYGRVASVVKGIKNQLAYVEQARKIMLRFPSVKTAMPTVVITGFPNVGKTTLLSKLTGAKAEIKSYAFTTKGINIGYFDNKRVQVIDTPGSLNRFNQMNAIEKQAYLTIKYCADLIIYVFDLTEASYPIPEQEKLHKNIKKFDKPMVVYLSKTDRMKEVKCKYKNYTLEEIKQKLKKLSFQH